MYNIIFINIYLPSTTYPPITYTYVYIHTYSDVIFRHNIIIIVVDANKIMYLSIDILFAVTAGAILL